MNLLLNEEADLQKLIFDAEYLVERRNPKALPLAKRAMQLAMRSANPQYFIYAKYILAFYYSLVKNDYDKSIEICQEVLEAMGAEGNEISYKLYMTLGNSYQLKGEIFSAQECYMKGLKQLESRKKLNSRERNTCKRRSRSIRKSRTALSCRNATWHTPAYWKARANTARPLKCCLRRLKLMSA